MFTLPTVQSVISVHALLSRLAIRADSLVLILQNIQHLIEGEGWVQTDTCIVSCRQLETHGLSVSGLGTTYTLLGVDVLCRPKRCLNGGLALMLFKVGEALVQWSA